MRRVTLLTSLVVLLALVPAGALASSSSQIFRDCLDGQLDGSYSNSQLDSAEKQIPSDIEEYSNCRGAIDQARLDNSSGSSGGGSGGAGGGSGGAGGSSGSSGSPTGKLAPENNPQALLDEQRTVKDAKRNGDAALRVNPETLITPGATGLPASEALRRSVPEPLLAMLILLAAVTLVGTVLGVRARVVARRPG